MHVRGKSPIVGLLLSIAVLVACGSDESSRDTASGSATASSVPAGTGSPADTGTTDTATTDTATTDTANTGSTTPLLAPPTTAKSTTKTTISSEGSTPAMSSGSIDPGLKPYIDIAVGDLAQRLSVGVDQIEVISATLKEWPDASLGCPQPGMQYAQVMTDGALIVLSSGGKSYNYHAGGSRTPFLCS